MNNMLHPGKCYFIQFIMLRTSHKSRGAAATPVVLFFNELNQGLTRVVQQLNYKHLFVI